MNKSKNKHNLKKVTKPIMIPSKKKIECNICKLQESNFCDHPRSKSNIDYYNQNLCLICKLNDSNIALVHRQTDSNATKLRTCHKVVCTKCYAITMESEFPRCPLTGCNRKVIEAIEVLQSVTGH